MFEECRPLIERRIVEYLSDPFQRKSELSVQQNLLQPNQIRVAVEPVPCLGPSRWSQQADGVVVMQRPAP